MRLFSQVLLLIIFSYVLYFVPKNVYAEETGFRFPTTCQTDGSSCDNMRTQDTNYNSWIQKGYEEVKVTFTDLAEINMGGLENKYPPPKMLTPTITTQ